ncbi:Alpha/Beta hydrolase protein [Amylocystis lapponica]|nr:Alpha/Beta hydrolase protein [Amylocystis lapponica]
MRALSEFIGDDMAPKGSECNIDLDQIVWFLPAPRKQTLWSADPSPISSDAVIQNLSAHVEQLFVDPITSTVYHIEARPSEEGRGVIVKTLDDVDAVGREWDIRTGVHEYGGAPAIAYGGILYFSNRTNNRVYMAKEGEKPQPITPGTHFYFVHLTDLLVAILEDHTKPAPADVVTTLCLINSQTQTVSTLVSGADFYMCPCFSPDGTRFAWQQWFHPDMPWDGAEVCVASVSADATNLTVSDIKVVAGKRIDISAGWPTWASNDVLLFTSDETGYQNPWTYSVSSGKASLALSRPVEQDFSLIMWNIGIEWGAPLDLDGKFALFAPLRDGRSILTVVNLQDGTLTEIVSPYRVTHDTVAFIGEKSTEARSVVPCKLTDYSSAQFITLKAPPPAPDVPPSCISVASSITLKTDDGPLHVVYFPPTHPDYIGVEGETPPCVLNAHGGPAGLIMQGLNWTKQFFTSRGWAWLDVNFGGSSGYGRKYMERLTGNWGIVDVQDCARAVRQLAQPPFSLLDAQRCAIRGESAGGYTTLAALCFEPTTFGAGTSLFGVSDLRALAEDTHKFESHYVRKLVGGSYKELPEVWRERSPLYNAEKIKAPLLVLQGSIDAVVPPAQAKDMVRIIGEQRGRVELHIFKGEGHGWRKAENIKTALEKELSFYEGVFGLKEWRA